MAETQAIATETDTFDYERVCREQAERYQQQFDALPEHDRIVLERVRGRLAQQYGEFTQGGVMCWAELNLEEGLTADDIEQALEFYLRPPWPSPGAIRHAHVSGIEYRNHEERQTLAFQLMHDPPSPRRDALLRELGYSRQPPTPLPALTM